MSGRGDNNKHGSAGRGASNQSNQGSKETDKVGKSDHDKDAGNSKASKPQPKTKDQAANRNESVEKD